MKKYGLYMTLLCLHTGLMLSCIKEKVPAAMEVGATADVVLTISRGVGSGTMTDSKEGIKKMRVIAASVNGNEETLLQNEEFYDETNFNAQTYTVSLNRLPKGKTKFYVICNEGSLPSDVQTYLSGLTEGTSLSGFAGYVVEDGSRSAFPKLRMYIDDNVGVPITGISETIDLQSKIETISFNIQYMVSKITVNVTNNTSSPITPNGFVMSSFFPNKAYLFPQANAVPDNTEYVGWTFDITCNPINSGVKSEGVINLYTYPSASGNYTAKLRLNNGASYNPIPFFRGTALDRGIYAELNGIFGTNPTPEFSYTVKDWENAAENNVPGFN